MFVKAMKSLPVDWEIDITNQKSPCFCIVLNVACLLPARQEHSGALIISCSQMWRGYDLLMMSKDALKRPSSLPMAPLPQVVPSRVCFNCKVCCRFPEQDSIMRPYFTAEEVRQAIDSGIDSSHFPNLIGCQVEVIPDSSGQGYLCPAFDPATSFCRVYELCPLDCQIYPFVVMWSKDGSQVLLGWDPTCPFLLDQCSPDNSQRIGSGTNLCDFPLPEDTLNVAQRLADRLQTHTMASTFESNSQLVMRFQVDVRVIQTLPILTQRLLS